VIGQASGLEFVKAVPTLTASMMLLDLKSYPFESTSNSYSNGAIVLLVKVSQKGYYLTVQPSY